MKFKQSVSESEPKKSLISMQYLKKYQLLNTFLISMKWEVIVVDNKKLSGCDLCFSFKPKLETFYLPSPFNRQKRVRLPQWNVLERSKTPVTPVKKPQMIPLSSFQGEE